MIEIEGTVLCAHIKTDGSKSLWSCAAVCAFLWQKHHNSVVPSGPSRLKVFVDGRHVGHYRLPVWTFQADKFVNIQSAGYPGRLGGFKSDAEIPPLVFAVQLVIGNLVPEVCVQESAEGQTVIPAATEVGDVYALVSQGLTLAPLEQGIAFGAAPFHQRCEGVLLLKGQIAVAVPADGLQLVRQNGDWVSLFRVRAGRRFHAALPGSVPSPLAGRLWR